MIKRLKHFYRRNFWPKEKYARHIGVKMGENCIISTTSFSSEPYLITLGNNVRITAGVKFFTHGAARVIRNKYNFKDFDFFGKIEINNNVYIGNNALIMPGVSIGDNVIIGAGSVVTKSVPSNSIVAGNPARVVGDIDSFFERMKKYNIGTKGLDYKEKKKVLLSLSDDKFVKK